MMEGVKKSSKEPRKEGLNYYSKKREKKQHKNPGRKEGELPTE